MLTVILTCEHGGNEIPEAYQQNFKNARAVLSSHEGWDIGAYELAKMFAQEYPLFFYANVSRLLIELNRSVGHPNLFSRYTKSLPGAEKELIMINYYHPYRLEVIAAIEQLIASSKDVLHLSVHTFTPKLNGKERKTDIGLLYDPQRGKEKNFSHQWQAVIYQISKQFRVRYNYPYLGKSDGFVTMLRKKFGDKHYSGIELEVNQKYFVEKQQQEISTLLLESFTVALNNFTYEEVR
jgi:predicted N-formylglutamate amidohydrolase